MVNDPNAGFFSLCITERHADRSLQALVENRLLLIRRNYEDSIVIAPTVHFRYGEIRTLSKSKAY